MHPVARGEVFRIGEEAIRNACLHSGGESLVVAVRYGRNLTVQVQDSGRRFDPKVLTSGKPGHFGIMGMRERAPTLEDVCHWSHPEETEPPLRLLYQEG
jgi:signal transduction histidine kinase